MGHEEGRGVVAALLVLEVATPMAAQACACGGFVGDQKVQVRQEKAIDDIEPGRETVTMQFAADTTATCMSPGTTGSGATRR